MISLKYYELELDIEGFYKTSSGIFIERIGSEGNLIPLHGKITKVPVRGKFKVGDIAYFHHHNLKYRQDKLSNTKTELPITENDILAVKRGDEWIGGSRIPAKRLKKEEPTTSIIIVEKEDAIDYESHRFEVDGEIVWIYTDSDYIFEYEPEMSFLRPEYIVYNESTEMCMNDFVVVRRDSESDEYMKQGLIYLPEKILKQKGRGTVIKKNKYGLEGAINFRKSKHQNVSTPLGDDISAVQFHSIQVCYEKS